MLPGFADGPVARGQGSCSRRSTRLRVIRPGPLIPASGHSHSDRLCSIRSAWTGARRSNSPGECSHHCAVPPTRVPGVSRRQCPGWYRGDLHTHTVHSDGRRRIEEMAEAAISAGLDFIVSTDHNTSSANSAWAARSAELEVIAGEEVTTRHGHWLAVGLPPEGWVDWRYAPRDGVFAGYSAAGSTPTAAWWWPPTRQSRCPAVRGSSGTAMWTPSRSGTVSGMSMTNCRYGFGISSCDKVAESPPWAEAVPRGRTANRTAADRGVRRGTVDGRPYRRSEARAVATWPSQAQ